MTPDELVDPTTGIPRMLDLVDKNMAGISGQQTVQRTMAGSALSQVYATCALVHAVRELTQAVRSLKEQP